MWLRIIFVHPLSCLPSKWDRWPFHQGGKKCNFLSWFWSSVSDKAFSRFISNQSTLVDHNTGPSRLYTRGAIFLLDKYFLIIHFPTVGWRECESAFLCAVIMFFPPFPLFTLQNQATPAHSGLNYNPPRPQQALSQKWCQNTQSFK